MNRNRHLVPEIQMRIESQKRVRGEFNLRDIAEYADKLGYKFNAARAREHEIARFCRNIIAGFRDSDGDRTLLAVGYTGEYIDLERCKKNAKLQATYKSLKKKHDGISKTMQKTRREIDGQLDGQIRFATEDGAAESVAP